MLSLVEYTGAHTDHSNSNSAHHHHRPSESRSPDAHTRDGDYASSETFDGSSQSAPSPGQSIAATEVDGTDANETEDGEDGLGDGALDLSLPLRKRAGAGDGTGDGTGSGCGGQVGSQEDASQPSYKKSLIRRYCKFLLHVLGHLFALFNSCRAFGCFLEFLFLFICYDVIDIETALGTHLLLLLTLCF